MQMHEQAQVTAEALHHDEHSRVQVAAAAQPVLALALLPKRLHHPLRKPPAHPPEQPPVVAQPHRHRALEAQHPLPPRNLRQAVLDQERRGLGHAPAHARGADAAALAGERDAQAVPAAGALRHQEAVLEVSAGDERFELVPHESRQRAGPLLEPLAERRPVLAHQGEGVAVLGGPRNVARLSVTVGHCTALLMRKPGHSRIAVFEGGCTARGSPGGPRVDQPPASSATPRQLRRLRQLRQRGQLLTPHASAGRPSRHAEI